MFDFLQKDIPGVVIEQQSYERIRRGLCTERSVLFWDIEASCHVE
jgi:hypothetical protein